VADRIFSFEGNGIIRQYEGNYSDYSQSSHRQESLEDTGKSREARDKVNEKEENKKERPLKFTYKEQKEFDQIDGIIAVLEADIQRVTINMNEASSDFEQLQKLISEKEQLEKQLDEAIERWAYLNELAQEIERRKKGE
jgi:ATP-binding cassette subfamily F protein uup